jgi:hypothetical protein
MDMLKSTILIIVFFLAKRLNMAMVQNFELIFGSTLNHSVQDFYVSKVFNLLLNFMP